MKIHAKSTYFANSYILLWCRLLNPTTYFDKSNIQSHLLLDFSHFMKVGDSVSQHLYSLSHHNCSTNNAWNKEWLNDLEQKYIHSIYYYMTVKLKSWEMVKIQSYI